MAISSAVGGAAATIFNKLKMDKKDAADVSQKLISSLFDQHQSLLKEVSLMNSEATEFRTKMREYETQIASYVKTVKELQHSIDETEKENGKLRKLVEDLKKELKVLESKK